MFRNTVRTSTGMVTTVLTICTTKVLIMLFVTLVTRFSVTLTMSETIMVMTLIAKETWVLQTTWSRILWLPELAFS